MSEQPPPHQGFRGRAIDLLRGVRGTSKPSEFDDFSSPQSSFSESFDEDYRPLRSAGETTSESSDSLAEISQVPKLNGDDSPTPNEDSSLPNSELVRGKGIRLGGNPISDVSTDLDTLHFQPYVDAVAAFLDHKDTKPPITMSIEGEWGSGKTSFMRQVEKRLAELLRTSHEVYKNLPREGRKSPPAGHVSFKFNAWRHDKQDAMWASFALCLTTEIRNKQSLFRRLRGDVYLTILRLSTLEGWFHVGSALLLWIALLLSATSVVVVLSSISAANLKTAVGRVVPILAEKAGLVAAPKPTTFSPAALALAQKHAWLASLLILALGWRWVSKHLGSRLDWKLKKYLNKPDYESHSAFIEGFHRDFTSIVKAYAGDDRVYVFIDDLDRCDVPRAAELMQAINLMIGDDSHLVFIIGMDREKVAAGIAYKYKDIAPFLRASNLDAVPTARHPSSLGYSYLEKFIQVTFRVPRPSEVGINEFLASISGSKGELRSTVREKATDQGERERRRQLVEPRASADSEEVADLVKIVAPTLEWNPRRIKQFINSFRLHAYVASDLGLLDIVSPYTNAERRARLTLEQLGKFVAITITWPDLVMDLLNFPSLLLNMYLIIPTLKDVYNSSGLRSEAEIESAEAALVNRWSNEKLLVSLLGARVSGDDGWRYSLKYADLSIILNVTKRENRDLQEEASRSEVGSSAASAQGRYGSDDDDDDDDDRQYEPSVA